MRLNSIELIEFLNKWDVMAYEMKNGNITGITQHGIKEIGNTIFTLITVIDELQSQSKIPLEELN